MKRLEIKTSNTFILTKKRFYSNGKLLLTAEYLVLDGAKALALPTKFGQDFIVENGINQEIYWKSFDRDGSIWFETTIPFVTIIQNLKKENQPVLNTLIEILHQAYQLNPSYINVSQGYTITTHLTFPKNWGLGTSSTLINNVGQWLNIDAFELLKMSFGGSGYDIACAQNNQAITYQIVNGKPIVQPLVFTPECVESLYFVYLNLKQSSKEAIAMYNRISKKDLEIIQKINSITENLILNSSFESFSNLIENHENSLSEILNTATVKSKLFPDFDGTIKSLGAWGGDFVLVISKENPSEYFKEKGFETIVPYAEMIL